LPFAQIPLVQSLAELQELPFGPAAHFPSTQL
jgi:hypothetical protein